MQIKMEFLSTKIQENWCSKNSKSGSLSTPTQTNSLLLLFLCPATSQSAYMHNHHVVAGIYALICQLNNSYGDVHAVILQNSCEGEC